MSNAGALEKIADRFTHARRIQKHARTRKARLAEQVREYLALLHVAEPERQPLQSADAQLVFRLLFVDFARKIQLRELLCLVPAYGLNRAEGRRVACLTDVDAGSPR